MMAETETRPAMPREGEERMTEQRRLQLHHVMVEIEIELGHSPFPDKWEDYRKSVDRRRKMRRILAEVQHRLWAVG